MQCETVKVVSPKSDDNPTGYIVINKSDLTKDHTLYEEPVESSATDNSKLTVLQLKEALFAAGIVFDENAKKVDLVALLDAGKSE
jgi:hypothetical protein